MGIPLTPTSGGGQCIGTGALRPADIIVSTTAAGISRTIRFATSSVVSHAMLYAGNDNVIEAIGEGVVRRTLRLATSHATLAVAYRHRNVTADVGASIVRYAEQFIGRDYDAAGAAGAGIADNGVICVAVGIVPCLAARAGAFNSRDDFYCSELVLEAFRLGGVPILDAAPSMSTPQHLVSAHSSGKLQYVGHVVA